LLFREAINGKLLTTIVGVALGKLWQKDGKKGADLTVDSVAGKPEGDNLPQSLRRAMPCVALEKIEAVQG